MLVLVGVIGALWIRKVQKPERFEGSHLGEADLILALIATIVISLLLWHATRIALHLNEWPASWSPVSNALSHLFADNQTTKVLERVFVWIHVLTILGFLAYLPRSKHLHIFVPGSTSGSGARAPGPARAAQVRRPRRPRRRTPVRSRRVKGPDVEAGA